jgi:putative spermidine/putrescine transport system ATP-binding protein
MTKPFLSIKAIAKHYGSVTAVEDVSLDIDKGEFVTFLGPSGSGKSTTLYVIAGFEDPSVGDVELEGSSLLVVPSNRRNIGMVFQRYTLFPNMTVAENVAFPLRIRRRPKAEIDAKVKRMLELARLERYADRMPGQLSGGQQQRVALARALVYDPPILLMDEPLSALDKKLREEIQFEIKRIHNETGVTILYVTHDQEEALRLSDRVALFNHGRIEQIGSGRDLYDDPRTRFVAGFIGNSNFLPGRLVERRGATGRLQLPDGAFIDGVPVDGLAGERDDVTLMLRPERISLRKTSPTPGSGLKGTVTDTIFLGECVQFSVRTAWGDEFAARIALDHLPACQPGRGDEVDVVWDGTHAKVFTAV